MTVLEERQQANISSKQCAERGCTNPPNGGKGLCRKHYMRQRRDKMPVCKVPGCTKPQQSREMCIAHYGMWLKTGSVERTNRDWQPIVARAAEIVRSYDIPVTLRQLFYRLVSERLIKNNDNDYGQLSRLTADRRRDDGFPTLYEHGRNIQQYATWDSPADALRDAADNYRVDRTTGQDVTIILGIEKNALGGLMLDWFGDTGIPVVPLGGYGSETLERAVRNQVRRLGRPAVFIYAGDFDPSGMNIGRVFVENTADCWQETVRVGLTERQVFDKSLPVIKGKKGDARAAGFIAEFPRIHRSAGFGPGVPVQVELDAVEPLELRQMYQDAIDQWWDADAYAAALEAEREQREQLQEIAEAA